MAVSFRGFVSSRAYEIWISWYDYLVWLTWPHEVCNIEVGRTFDDVVSFEAIDADRSKVCTFATRR